MYKNLIYYTLLFFLFSGSVLKSQNNQDFYKLLDKSIERLYQNPNESINFTEGILFNQQDPEHQMMLKNVISQAFIMKGEFVQSLRVSMDVENLDYNHTISNFSVFYSDYALAEQYQNVGLFNQSSRLLNEIIQQYSNSLNISKNSKITLAKVYQLESINQTVFKNYEKAIELIEKSTNLLEVISAENSILQLENSIFKASIYIQKQEINEAKNILHQTILFLDKNDQFPFVKAFAYERAARASFLEKDYLNAIKYLEIANKAIIDLDYNLMKSYIYLGFSRNYLALNNKDKYQIFDKKYTDLKSKLEMNQKEGIRYLVKLTEAHEDNYSEYLQLSQQKKSNTILLTIGCIVGIASLILLYVYKNTLNAKKQLDFFNDQIQFLENRKTNSSTENVKEIKRNLVIHKDTENEIIMKLSDFEKSDRFLNPEISLAVLAGQLETNTKYLSEVINKYKGKNFNSYINHLRINYIAYLLKTQPEYLNYKVSYLATISGFSSHSSFATVFKSVTGVSPNVYIQQINQLENG